MPLADGSWVALEAPYYAYVESYPRAPAPGTGANTEKGFSFSDLMLVVALIGVGMFALPAGILAGGFNEALVERRKKTGRSSTSRCPHCGKRH